MTDLENLIGYSESSSLEFKQTLYDTRDPHWKREWCKDISAFANANGGWLIFGVREEAGAADALCGIESSDVDKDILQLQQVADQNIEPRIHGLALRPIRIGEGDTMLL